MAGSVGSGAGSLKVLVAEPLASEGIGMLEQVAEVDVRLGLSHEDLRSVMAEYDAVVVRSATKIDADVIDAASRLKVIGRAGTGFDNIDVDAATRRGILVVNAPQANTLSAAEHTMGMLLALARHIPEADASVRGGAWERSKFTGVELHGKTLGILGLGRIGTLVAQRASAFGMRILAFDPYVSRARAAQMGVDLAETMDELLMASDFVTIHMPKTSETSALIGERELSLMKTTARIINVSRGGLIDEAALVQSLKEGRIAGAALDVFDQEPPAGTDLVGLGSVVVTPHLGGSTEEAQTKAGTAIAEQVVLALRGEFAPYAVNIEGGAGYVEAMRPFVALAEKLGKILTGVGGAGVSEVNFEFHGSIAEHDTKILTLAGLKGMLSPVLHEPVTYVNAPLIAADRGIQVTETKTAMSMDYVNLVQITAGTDAGPVTVAGSLVGKKDEERIVRVYDYTIDMLPERYMCFLRYKDVPGVIGKVGTVLGDADINIAGMQVSRENIGGEALMGLTVDSEIPSQVIAGITEAIGARDAHFIDLG